MIIPVLATVVFVRIIVGLLAQPRLIIGEFTCYSNKIDLYIYVIFFTWSMLNLVYCNNMLEMIRKTKFKKWCTFLFYRTQLATSCLHLPEWVVRHPQHHGALSPRWLCALASGSRELFYIYSCYCNCCCDIIRYNYNITMVSVDDLLIFYCNQHVCY